MATMIYIMGYVLSYFGILVFKIQCFYLIKYLIANQQLFTYLHHSPVFYFMNICTPVKVNERIKCPKYDYCESKVNEFLEILMIQYFLEILAQIMTPKVLLNTLTL